MHFRHLYLFTYLGHSRFAQALLAFAHNLYITNILKKHIKYKLDINTILYNCYYIYLIINVYILIKNTYITIFYSKVVIIIT